MSNFELEYKFPKKYFDRLLILTAILIVLNCITGITVARYKLQMDYMEKQIEDLADANRLLKSNSVHYKKEYEKIIAK